MNKNKYTNRLLMKAKMITSKSLIKKFSNLNKLVLKKLRLKIK